MKNLAAFLFVLFATYFAYGQTPDWLIGQWKGEGTLFNQEAKFEMNWAWQWNGKFLKLKYTNQVINGQYPKFDVEAYYQLKEAGKYRGYWFDSRGSYVEVGSKLNTETKTFTSVWGSPSTEQGRTVYQLNEDGTMVVKDFVLRSNGYELFGKAVYSKL